MSKALIRAVVSIALLGFAALFAQAEESATAPSATTSRLLLSGHYQVRVDGEIVPDVKVYSTRGLPRIVLEHDLFGGTLVITGGEKTVRLLTADAVIPTDETRDMIDVDFSQTTGDSVAVVAKAGVVSFSWKERTIEVEGREPLLGEVTAEVVLASLPEYRRGKAAYVPGKGAIRLLNGQSSGKIEIEVFFGSWCPHCEQVLPRLLRVFEELDANHFALVLHAVPRRFTSYEPAKKAGIEELPTAIIRKGDKIIAKMTGRNWTKPETALSALLLEDLEAGPSGGRPAP